MSEPVVTTAIAAIAAVISAIITAVLARRTGAATNRVDAVEVTVTGMEKLVAAQDKRIGSLERELATVKDALLVEQQQHAATRELLRIAMRHIRDMLSWLGSDRAAAPPAVPDELTHQL